MVVAAGKVLLPGPAVFHGQELVHVGARVDHALFVDADAGGAALDGAEASGVGRHGSGPAGDGCGRGMKRLGIGPVEHHLINPAHWQASQVGSAMEQALGAVIRTGAAETALSLPSVPFRVDFSTWVAERARK